MFKGGETEIGVIITCYLIQRMISCILNSLVNSTTLKTIFENIQKIILKFYFKNFLRLAKENMIYNIDNLKTICQ